MILLFDHSVVCSIVHLFTVVYSFCCLFIYSIVCLFSGLFIHMFEKCLHVYWVYFAVMVRSQHRLRQALFWNPRGEVVWETSEEQETLDIVILHCSCVVCNRRSLTLVHVVNESLCSVKSVLWFLLYWISGCGEPVRAGGYDRFRNVFISSALTFIAAAGRTSVPWSYNKPVSSHRHEC